MGCFLGLGRPCCFVYRRFCRFYGGSIMITRKEYVSGACTHAEYYGQFVTERTRQAVARAIGADWIRNSTDPHFNDIPLHLWDRLTASLPAVSIASVGDDWSTPAGLVCIAKEAARQIKEGHKL